MPRYVLAIDQGTTSSRAILFDENLRPAAIGQREFPQHFPASGWVEHDLEDIWSSVAAVCREAIERAGARPAEIAAIGLTNQRETAALWERAGGKPIHRAIVWQDRRTAKLCARLRAEGAEGEISARSGLLADPYFSATKIAWMLDEIPGARAKAEAGELAFGTIDSFLIWRLTGGAVHATDATNAARTSLYNIRQNAWDPELLRIFNVPAAILPQVRDCAAEYGASRPDLFGRPIPILGVAGDQQAATVGQACFAPGMVKSTYGTGCFALLNTGSAPAASRNRLLTTIAYRLEGRSAYALEGSIFVAGAAAQWLRDGLGVIRDAKETEALAAASDPAQAVYLVPAFTGLGAPYWDAEARGALFGLTRATGPAELARAALEAIGYQTRDLIEAMRADWPETGDTVLRVDGGVTASDWAMGFLADILGAPVDRPAVQETTALGAAWLAGMAEGLYPGQERFAQAWSLERRFEPALPAGAREEKYAGWRDAVRRTLSSAAG